MMSDANSYWYCPTCDEKLDGEAVTFEELHDPKYGGCGFKVESRSRTPNRPPSCDRLNPELKECPFCGAEAAKHPKLEIIRCRTGCNIYGPDNDPYGHKWNSIPRRSKVMELLRLVDGYFAGKTDPLDLRICADKLRKEMGE